MADKDDDGEKTVIGAPLPAPSPHPGLSPARPAPVPPSDDAAEKTVIGGRLPVPSATPAPNPPKPTPPEDSEKTIIGGAMPPVQTPPVSPYSDDGATIVGGALPPAMPKPTRPSPPAAAPRPAPTPAPPTPKPTPKPTYVPPQPAEPSPVPQPAPIAAPQAAVRHQPQVTEALQNASASGSLEALRARSPLSNANTANPFFAAGADLLLLLGRLRTGDARISTQVLYVHTLQAVVHFEQTLQANHVDAHDTLVAKYALCGTIDDIVQNLPDVDQPLWRSQPLVSRFFSKRDSNIGFFQEAQKAIQSPANRYNLLEFMLICLNLGFEGQYRGQAGGTADLTSIRNAILETLRRTRPHDARPLSVSWTPVEVKRRGGLRAVPIWALASMALLAIAAFFATLSNVLNKDGTALADWLYALHPAQTPITLERVPGPVFVAPASQFERLSDGLADDLAAGRLELSQQGDFIIIRVGNADMFTSGSSDVNPAFDPLAARIAAGLEGEDGPILVLGYTDSQGAFNTNMKLSVGRAEAVADLLRNAMNDPLRVSVEGRGETEPIADNSTETGRAKNRRVEIKLAREGTF